MAEAYNFFPTAGEIILGAFEIIRLSDMESGQVPTSAQYIRAANMLNMMLTAWQADGLQLWTRKTTSFSLTQGTINYSVGSGATININRPMKIYNAWRHDLINNTDVPIRVVSEKEYNEYNNKQQQGTPIALYYNPRYESNSVQEGSTAAGLISVYQPADANAAANYSIFINYQRPFNDFTPANYASETLDFPQEWNEAIKYNLAVRLGNPYGIPMLEWDRIRSMAKELKEEAMAFDTEWESLKIQPRQN
jgi:hypothetical protein